MQRIEHKPHKPYKCLTFLTMLYFCCWLSVLLTNKKVIFFPIFHTLWLSMFFGTILFIVSDIITEVYGYKVFQKILFSSLILVGLYSLIMPWAMQLPSPANVTTGAKFNDPNAFMFLFDTMLRDFSGIALFYLLGSYINSRLLSKWKILLKGRYFWLRSISTSLIGLFFYAVLSTAIIGFFIHKFEPALIQALKSFGFKIIALIVFAGPANLICYILKKVEGVDVYDYGVNYNPFSKLTDHAKN